MNELLFFKNDSFSHDPLNCLPIVNTVCLFLSQANSVVFVSLNWEIGG